MRELPSYLPPFVAKYLQDAWAAAARATRPRYVHSCRGHRIASAALMQWAPITAMNSDADAILLRCRSCLVGRQTGINS